MNESVCILICVTYPTSSIPEVCVQQQSQGDNQALNEEQQQPLDQQQQQPGSDSTSSTNSSTNILANIQNFGPSSSTNVHFPTPSECYIDLTGKWIGNDGEKYYIRQIDWTIWWFGFNTFQLEKVLTMFSMA